MGLTSFQRFSFRLLGSVAKRSKTTDRLRDPLMKARMPIRADAYLAQAWTKSVVTGIGTLFFLVGILLVLSTVAVFASSIWVIVALSPFVAGFVAYAAITSTPGSTAKKRGRGIDARLPYASNYIAAMSSAGVLPQDIFASLSRQDIYGEVAKEAAMIYKDLHVHGIDIVSALRRAIDRSPSVKLQEMLQGAITTVTSGGDLTSYFRQKSARYQWENRVEQKSFVETMGLMAETYVTAAVAGPLFLIVMMAIIVLMGGGDISQLQMVVYLLLPVINVGFMLGVKSMIPEV